MAPNVEVVDRVKVLVLEQDGVTVSELVGLLASEGFEVVEADIHEALKVALEQSSNNEPPSRKGIARIGAIASCIPKMTPDDFTKSGAPEVRVLEEMLGMNITAAERDEAFTFFHSSSEKDTPASKKEEPKVISGLDGLKAQAKRHTEMLEVAKKATKVKK